MAVEGEGVDLSMSFVGLAFQVMGDTDGLLSLGDMEHTGNRGDLVANPFYPVLVCHRKS